MTSAEYGRKLLDKWMWENYDLAFYNIQVKSKQENTIYFTWVKFYRLGNLD